MGQRKEHQGLRERLHGQVMILFALGAVVLIGMLALAVDVGFLLSERRQVQAAADAGAMAAADSFIKNENWEAAGEFYGSTNADVPTGNVEVRHPTTGRFTGADYIEVVVTKDVQRFFLGAVYNGEWSVTARAVAAVETGGVDAAMLALNPDSGGIVTGGYTRIEAVGGGIVSNHHISGSGNTTLISDQSISANDGILRSGTTNTFAPNVNPNGPEVPDPFAEALQPPALPASPGNLVGNVNPTPQSCPTRQMPDWNPPYVTTLQGGTYNNCNVNIVGRDSGPFTFPNQAYRFNGGSITMSYQNQTIIFDRGTWNFNGGTGINLNGSSTMIDMRGGSYSFTNGARISLGGQTLGNRLGGNFYFSGGGGISAGGQNTVTLHPGIYVFDGGPGLNFSGNSTLHFAPGNFEFWFLNGADLTFSGSARISADPDSYARMYFYGTQNNYSDLSGSGWTDAAMSIPSGQYYFDRGRMLMSGSSILNGNNVFFYFTNGGYLDSSGSASYSLTAPTTSIYTGYQPGVLIYSDRSNTATFRWQGRTGAYSWGAIYLPSSKMTLSGDSSGVGIRGQLIADSFDTSGNTVITIEYEQIIEVEVPRVFLVD